MTQKESWFKHLMRAEQYAKLIQRLFDDATKEAIRMGYSIQVKPDKMFEFKDYPQLTFRVKKLFTDLHDKVHYNILRGTDEAWKDANVKNDALVDSILGTLKVPRETLEGYMNRNLEALETFQNRKTNQMNLSQRIWKLVEPFKSELEMSLDIVIGEGKSAAMATQDVKQYLKEPDKLFRRVRDKHGILRESKAMKAYQPGPGIYKSSFKNSRRLTSTEINMAYRSSDHERWQNLDFVVGVEVHRSHNHSACDVCDAFIGKYPKGYKFISNHPNCKCFATSILATKKELSDIIAAKNDGEDLSDFVSVNKVSKMPDGFMNWIKDNKKRIMTARSVPYFIRDNYNGGNVTKGLKFM